MIRRLIVLFALALVYPTAASAATNSLRDGAWGLEFQVQTPLFSSSYTGAAGIGAIHNSSERSAVRLGLMVGINSQDTDGTRTSYLAYPSDTLGVAQTPSYSDHRDVSMFLHLVRYVGVGKRIGFSVEGGPSARWLSEEYGRTDYYTFSQAFSSITGDLDSWSYGGDLQVGFVWFFRTRLSLGGRYGITALRTESKETLRRDFYNPPYGGGAVETEFEESHSDGFVIQTTPALISLTAYF
jgi:hypothetical protein